ncbi:uncharacterized protein LOC125448232 isoform X2 [Stegostoma tigrinum]|uniref:uncharacterized protein LOC125448232 isoform X2 n=1 Tax=Stegostoma tigrinum TaxID=3053191 RepID=UPI00287090F1|nr:uncharacterized protein LOC125448232 isoform X2 [Stegostoma tigrinum]
MGSPISGFLAEAVMQRLEQTALPIIQPKLWVQYVDDTFVITKQNKLEETFKTINNTLTGITFTKEAENSNKLPFLDVTVQRTVNGELQSSVYRKTTHTDQILNYRSNHPNTHKRSCIRTLFQQATTHCSTEELRRAEENHLYSILKKNGYPMNTVRRFLSNKPKQTDKTGSETITTLPYIKDIPEMTARLRGPLGIRVAHKPTNTLKQQLMNFKDTLQTTSKTNVIYKIPCKNCDKHYVGQTGRKLATRIHEHQLATKRHDPLSRVSLHTDEEGHHFDWDKTSILGQAKQRHAREFREAWHSNRNSINKHIDLEPIYHSLRKRTGNDINTGNDITIPRKPKQINRKRDITPALHRRLADDVTKNGDETSENEPSSSASKLTSSRRGVLQLC